MMDGFVIPASTPGSPDSVARRRRMAELMLVQSGQPEKITHWSQGANKLAQALMGGLSMRRADQQEEQGRKGANDMLARALSGDMGVAPSQQDPQGTMVEAMNDPWMSPQGQQMLYQQWQQQNTPPDPMKELQMQKLRAEIQQMNNPEMQQPELGLNPQFGVDAQGNPVMIQIGKDGRAVQTAMPEGVKLAKEPIKFDAGTHFILLDPITRQPVGQIPKDLAGAEREKELGTAEGKAQAAASSDMAAAETALTLLDSIEKDPNLDRGTGFSSVFNFVPGTAGRDFQTKVDQATSGAFLSAIQQMRGMGALSNAEGQTATQAVTRMTTSASKEEFMSALNDYRAIVQAGYDRAAAKAGVKVDQTAPIQQGGQTKRLRFNPQTGELE